MALKSIKDFPKATPGLDDLILVEQTGGEGRSISIKEFPVSVPVEEKIENRTTLLESRLDNLLLLPEGSTVADGQLKDISVGYDGQKYDTPANAVRTQVATLAGDIDLLSAKSDEHDRDISDLTGRVSAKIDEAYVEDGELLTDCIALIDGSY